MFLYLTIFSILAIFVSCITIVCAIANIIINKESGSISNSLMNFKDFFFKQIFDMGKITSFFNDSKNIVGIMVIFIIISILIIIMAIFNFLKILNNLNHVALYMKISLFFVIIFYISPSNIIGIFNSISILALWIIYLFYNSKDYVLEKFIWEKDRQRKKLIKKNQKNNLENPYETDPFKYDDKPNVVLVKEKRTKKKKDEISLEEDKEKK